MRPSESTTHKHWGKMRIRFKAAVHSGSIVDSLNDCVTKYCLFFEEQHWLKKQPKELDPNTMRARITRAAQALLRNDEQVSTANFCLSLDRGYGHVEAQEALAEMGIYSNSVMPLNRVGIPRNYLAELEKNLTCPDQMVDGKEVACNHDPDAKGCNKFVFTALHKKNSNAQKGGAAGADWELACWVDGQLIVSLSNFFSTSRCGTLTRGGSNVAESYSVWAPESIWHYNLQGRSATDGCDQLRKRMSVAERRTLRIGVKGIFFVFDLAFTNAAIMWHFVHCRDFSRGKLNRDFNKVSAN